MLWKNYKETKDWKAIDMILYLAAPLIQVLTSLYSVSTFVILSLLFVNTQVWSDALTFACVFSIGGTLLSFGFTAMVVKMEHHKLKQVRRSSYFTFWFFLLSWVFINVVCFVKPIKSWEPIEHTKSVNFAQLGLDE